MTLVENMEFLADFLRKTVSEYSSEQPSGTKPVAVYAGYPPPWRFPRRKVLPSSMCWLRILQIPRMILTEPSKWKLGFPFMTKIRKMAGEAFLI